MGATVAPETLAATAKVILTGHGRVLSLGNSPCCDPCLVVNKQNLI